MAGLKKDRNERQELHDYVVDVIAKKQSGLKERTSEMVADHQATVEKVRTEAMAAKNRFIVDQNDALFLYYDAL